MGGTSILTPPFLQKWSIQIGSNPIPCSRHWNQVKKFASKHGSREGHGSIASPLPPNVWPSCYTRGSASRGEGVESLQAEWCLATGAQHSPPPPPIKGLIFLAYFVLRLHSKSPKTFLVKWNSEHSCQKFQPIHSNNPIIHQSIQ